MSLEGVHSAPRHLMDRIWIDPRDGKEWHVRFTSPLPSDPIARFYHPAELSTTREMLSVDLRGDEDLDAMTDQELMDLLDKATP